MSLQIKIIGTFVFFTISINAFIPPLSSFPAIPSTSSIIIKFLLFKLLSVIVVLFIKKPTLLFIVSLFRLSLAFNSNVLYPFELDITRIDEVFPIPGGPEIIAARAVIFSDFPKREFFAVFWGLINMLVFQLSNHVEMFFI